MGLEDRYSGRIEAPAVLLEQIADEAAVPVSILLEITDYRLQGRGGYRPRDFEGFVAAGFLRGYQSGYVLVIGRTQPDFRPRPDRTARASAILPAAHII
jgi:hypothetical protein